MKRKITQSFSFFCLLKIFPLLLIIIASTQLEAQTSCNAEFSYYALSSNPDSIHFYALDTDASFYYWSFGDGNTSTDPFPWHYYTSSGTYYVCLVVNDSGTYCTWCDSIEIGNLPCNAEFSFYSIGNDSLHFYPIGTAGTSWYWSFGDGTTSTDQYPWHQYSSAGMYYVCLTVNNSGTYCDYCDSVEVGSSLPCNAEFVHYPNGNPDSLHFYPIGTAAVSWYWSFGDGTYSTEQDPWHYYTTFGSFYACLTIVTSMGASCTWCDSVEVGSAPCNAEFSYYSIGNDSLHFYPVGTAGTSWYWSFGDGTTSTDQYPWHHYANAGTYYVCLIVNNSGTYCDWCDSVEVGNSLPCNAEFYHYTMGNDSLHFYPVGTAGALYYWNFGDGTTSTDQDPWHQYLTAGIYYVCLTVNNSGTYCTWCDSVEVGAVLCNAEFSFYSLSNPDSVHFYPNSTAGTSWYWSFGDGTTSTDEYPWHHYDNAGTYYVCLTLNNSGAYCTWCDSVTVGSLPCNAEFSYYTTSNPDSVHFYPINTSGTFYYWSFGDGTTSTNHDPWHFYTMSGDYYVCLVVNNSGTYCTWCDSIHIGLLPMQGNVLLNPNPSDDYATVYLRNMPPASVFRLYDVTGRMIFLKDNLEEGSFKINTKDFPIGLYYFSAINGKQIIAKGKLMVLHL